MSSCLIYPGCDCLGSLAINGIPHFAFSGFQPQAKSAPASARSPLERNWAFSSLSHEIRQDNKCHPVLFTLDAIRTHDLPLRRRLLYPAELPRHNLFA